MANAVLIPSAIAAMNVDSYNRSVSASAAVDNGNVLTMGAGFTSGSLTEVFAVTPSTASGTNLWMAYSGDEIILTDARYKGLDPDPRNFSNAAGKVFSAYKPAVGDIIVLTGDGFSNSRTAETHAAAQAGVKLLWTAAQATTGLCYKLIQTTYISLATGAIDSQRVTAYRLECVQI